MWKTRPIEVGHFDGLCCSIEPQDGPPSGRSNWVRVPHTTMAGGGHGIDRPYVAYSSLDTDAPACAERPHQEVRDRAISADLKPCSVNLRDKTPASGIWQAGDGSEHWYAATMSVRFQLCRWTAHCWRSFDELDITPTVDIIEQPIHHHSQIAISRDGSQVVFCSYGLVWSVDLNQGTTRYQAIGDFERTAIAFDSDSGAWVLGSPFGSFRYGR